MAVNLLSSTSRVETPFIIVNIGGYTFGNYSKRVQNVVDENGFNKKISASFPNFIDSLSVNKVNGSINTYTLNLVYAIQAGDDPNKVDKILSKASKDRLMTISYGDYSLPNFIYKEEEAIITKVTRKINIQSSTINYTISAVSRARLSASGNFNFPKVHDKPSNVFRDVLYNESYGLLDIFYGMRDRSLVEQKGLLKVDDKPVTIEARTNTAPLDYLSYLVGCMTSVTDTEDSFTSNHKFVYNIYDDVTGELGGPYIKLTKVAKTVGELNSLENYEIIVGYPTADIVVDFNVVTDDAYTLLYNYSQKIPQTEYGYRIDDEGNFDYIYAPNLITNERLFRPTAADKTWWNQVTSYPIKATLTLKGLLKPAILMSYVKLDVRFYGSKYNASGTYIVTQQTDNISASGFRTTLTLTRIMGDEE